MALTAAEQERVLLLLNQLDEQKKQRTLSSLESFANWLKSTLVQIYEKVKNVLESIWEGLCELFD